MSTAQSNAVKVIALSAASIALLSACGEPKATPMDDEYAGNSGESVQSQEEKSKTDGKASGDTADDGDAIKNRADANSATIRPAATPPPETMPMTRIPRRPASRTPATTRMAIIRSTASTARSARTPSTCI